jgi:hypothetical protein
MQQMARNDQSSRPKRKTPAERSDELLAASRRLKEESAERRERAADAKNEQPAEKDAPRG